MPWMQIEDDDGLSVPMITGAGASTNVKKEDDDSAGELQRNLDDLKSTLLATIPWQL